MAGRPSLRIGQHGKIVREYLGGGVWLARCRYRDSDGVTRRVQRLGPPDEHDQHGKLAEDALIEALAERRPPCGAGDISLDTLVMSLVDQHLLRLTDDGRSPVTLSTYKFATVKLTKFLGGVRVGEASTARLDAALRSMRASHGSTMARQAKTILRGELQLAVMANVLGANPVRDVQPLRSKSQPKGAVGLTADELRGLLTKLRASRYCQEHDLVDPITLLIATGLRRSELLALRWSDLDADASRHGCRQACASDRQRAGSSRRDQIGSRSSDVAAARLRGGHAPSAAGLALSRRAHGDFPIHHGDTARPQQLRQAMAHRPRGPGRASSDHAQLPQDRGHAD